MAGDKPRNTRGATHMLHVTPSERSLCRLWDEIDHTRTRRGEEAAARMAQAALKAAIQQEMTDDATVSIRT